ncbi:MAG: hypothetical protein Ct9H90mP7_5810 [Candidatus Neomarinimicrobiota bacterium]|nr:MAG: hypothetical protein Ct9H90mP7_5810 [Candidatus Neomarinimicrobiota bacterium]
MDEEEHKPMVNRMNFCQGLLFNIGNCGYAQSPSDISFQNVIKK